VKKPQGDEAMLVVFAAWSDQVAQYLEGCSA
jgi:hypothetical protein